VRILITGGAGFIGSNLADVLSEAGHSVGVIDDLSTGRLDNLASPVWFRELDILSSTFEAAMREFRPDAVVHLAAQASVQASLRDPDRDWAVNADGTRAVARAARLAGARRVLSASSAAVYGDPETVPLPETARLSPMNPYGRSKLGAEGLLAEELAGSGVDFASLRFSNVYGPRQDARGEGGVVSIFLDTIAAGGRPRIFGDGSQTRDFIFVADVARAIRAALESEGSLADGVGHSGAERTAAKGPADAAFNVSTGVETTLEALAEHVRKVSGFSGAFTREPAREGDIVRSALDPTKARDVLGWSAGVTLERGLAFTWEWFAAHADGDAPASGAGSGA
jgi:UDP-glucose 4-epimerase